MSKQLGQTRLESMVEAFFSNVLSYAIDVGFVLLVAPMLDIELSLAVISTAMAILCVLHFIKNFCYRRLWNYLLIRKYKKAGKNGTKKQIK